MTQPAPPTDDLADDLADDLTDPADRPGLLLVNLGTPDRPDVASVRRYLAEFLSDKRVIELPALLWQPILKGVVLRRRPPATAANYRKIWDREHDESPLRQITSEQAQALQAHFGADVQVAYAMRYGNPAIAAGLDALLAAGCTRLCVAPLYPQYANATTGTVMAEVFRCLAARRHVPALRVLAPYFAHPAYIEALRQSLQTALAALDFAPEHILLSFHGLPQKTVDAGDPYLRHCQRTAQLLRAASGLNAAQMPLCFQSRFGRTAWLQPYLFDTVRELAAAGARRIAVVTPGFAADGVETLEEVDLRARAQFLAAGGQQFATIPCLNTSAPGLALLRTLCSAELAGWLPARPQC